MLAIPSTSMDSMCDDKRSEIWIWDALAVDSELQGGLFQTWRYHQAIFMYAICSGSIGKVPQSNFR